VIVEDRMSPVSLKIVKNVINGELEFSKESPREITFNSRCYSPVKESLRFVKGDPYYNGKLRFIDTRTDSEVVIYFSKEDNLDIEKIYNSLRKKHSFTVIGDKEDDIAS